MEQAHKGQSTTKLYVANTKEVGHGQVDSKGVVWWWGGKVFIFGFQPWLLLGIYPDGMISYPKEVVDGWDHLIHAIEVGGEVAQSLSIWT